ncbi:MAG: 50S ribosomal protein L29 [Candidatus Aminicenantes bacterium]|nr:MAG: 50S ribosomal protein L29 [Candidatus Aminicenantes bacterium]
MRKNEIKQLLPEERKERISELRTELVRLRTMAASGGTVENPARIKEIKKTIARILTFENIDKKSQKGAR